jgi:hypothetical protein
MWDVSRVICSSEFWIASHHGRQKGVSNVVQPRSGHRPGRCRWNNLIARGGKFPAELLTGAANQRFRLPATEERTERMKRLTGYMSVQEFTIYKSRMKTIQKSLVLSELTLGFLFQPRRANRIF